jgi:molecular chaperone DnaK
MVIGSDIGYFSMKLAYADRTGQPVGVRNPNGGNSTRSFLYAKPDGGWLVGDPAYEQAFVDPKNAMCEFKLKLGSLETLLAGKNAEELTAALLEHGKELVEKQTGDSVDAAVAAVPAEFDDVQKKSLLRAYELAGIPVLRLISEPAAASFAYVEQRNTGARGDKFAVYDLGGGTLDITICEFDSDEVRVLATHGERELGGYKMDKQLGALIINKLAQATQCDARTLAADALFMLDLAPRITNAKVALGSRDEVQIPLAAAGKQHVITVSRAEFEALIAPIVDRTLVRFDECVKSANITCKELTSLFLVGGPSRMPYLQNRMATHTGMVPRCEIDPEMAVAYGAALVAQSELKKQGKRDRLGTDVIPPPRRVIGEITHHGIGVAVEDQTNGSTGIINAVVVPQNTKIPSRHSKRFRLESPDQRDALIQILQGDDRAEFKDCRVIASLEITSMPIEVARSPRIEVTFDFDKNGLVTVTARDIIGGDDTSTTIQLGK